MIENILVSSNVSVKTGIAVKTLIAAGLITLAALLPQIVHIAAGADGGMKWLPMYLPVLLAGCLLGVRQGLGVGIASPLFSFAVTSLAGNAMPAAARLPFMIAELAVFAVVSGLFSKKIYENGWAAFPAVLLAAVAGRAFFLLLAVIFQAVAPFTVEAAWTQVESGLIGLLLQAVLVPAVVILLRRLLVK